MSKFQTEKIEIQKSGSTMTSAIFQLVYMPNFRAIGQSVWEKNGNRQKHRQKHRQKDTLEFYKDRLAEYKDRYLPIVTFVLNFPAKGPYRFEENPRSSIVNLPGAENPRSSILPSIIPID